MRGDQLSRQWQILRHIEVNQNGATASEISSLGGVSLRTAYRDLSDLQHAGFPLYAEKDDRGARWKFVDSYRLKMPQPFSLTELMSLHLSRDVFRTLKGTVFYQSIEELFEKIQSAIPTHTMAFLDRIQEIFQMEIRPYKDYAKFGKIINRINQAAMECRRIELVYRPLKSKRDTFRKIDPYKIRFFEGTIYVIAFCHLRNEIRTFVLDRIKLLRLTDETFKPPENFDLNEYIKHSFKVMNGELYEVIIRITPAWARYVSEKIWHESQKTRKLDDGSVQLTFHVAGLDEIKQWILSLGPKAYVMEPEKLRKMIQSDLRKTLFQYEGIRAVQMGKGDRDRRTDYGG